MRGLRRLIICGSLALQLVPWNRALALPLASDARRVSFSIPPQALSTALIAYGKQANVQVLTASPTLAGLRSDGLQGVLTPDAALQRLLQSSGLAYSVLDANTVAITPAAPAPVDPAAAADDHRAGTPPKLLEQVDAAVLTEHAMGDVPAYASDALRYAADSIAVPQSVNVVAPHLMATQQVRTVADALRNVASVQHIENPLRAPLFKIRGIYTGNGMTDGMPNSFVGLGGYPPMIGVERVEVLKGPESILGDSNGGDMSGLINVVTKQPLRRPQRELSYALGERGDMQAGLDATGPIGTTPLSYRLVVSGQHADATAQGYGPRNAAYLAPSIAWQSEDTRLVLGVQRVTDRQPAADHALLLRNHVSAMTPRSLRLGNPQDHTAYRTQRAYYLLDQRLSDRWQLRSRGQYVTQAVDARNWGMLSPSPKGVVRAYAEAYRNTTAYYTIQNDLVGSFGDGPLQQTVTLGLDYTRARLGSSDYFIRMHRNRYDVFGDAQLGPVHWPHSRRGILHYPGSPWSSRSGILLQDQISVGERWDVSLALRRSAYEISNYDARGKLRQLRRRRWVPNMGVVYKLSPDAALYASTMNGFAPSAVLGKNGRPLPPALSQQVEVGAKIDLFDHRARLNVAYYQITVDRSFDLVLAHPSYFARPIDSQSNRGLDLDFVGALAPGLELSSSLALARIGRRDGTPTTGVPRMRFTLWSSYQFQDSRWSGWGVAGGILARDHTLGRRLAGGYFKIPGQASVDANVSYRTDTWGVTVGMRNVFDRRLYADDFDETFVPLPDSRSLLLTGTYRF